MHWGGPPERLGRSAPPQAAARASFLQVWGAVVPEWEGVRGTWLQMSHEVKGNANLHVQPQRSKNPRFSKFSAATVAMGGLFPGNEKWRSEIPRNFRKFPFPAEISISSANFHPLGPATDGSTGSKAVRPAPRRHVPVAVFRALGRTPRSPPPAGRRPWHRYVGVIIPIIRPRAGPTSCTCACSNISES